ncbi:MAG: Stp1/IreP family PP2C-type Ser/Thr phosphatase [Chlamydiota bacterium]
MPLKLESYGISDIGLVRANNEDVFVALPETHFFALADGMGGHKAGEIAARLAIMSLCKSLEENSPPNSVEETMELFREAILQANRLVYSMGSQNEKLGGMGTTLCCLKILKDSIIYAHVGDSRIYRFRNHKLDLLTHDHSLRHELILKGELDEKSAFSFPYKNIITRSIGTHSQVEPEINAAPFLSGDLYFLCSDGLSDYVSHEEIFHLLEKEPSIKNAANQMITLAKAKGGNDNITIVIIKIA